MRLASKPPYPFPYAGLLWALLLMTFLNARLMTLSFLEHGWERTLHLFARISLLGILGTMALWAVWFAAWMLLLFVSSQQIRWRGTGMLASVLLFGLPVVLQTDSRGHLSLEVAFTVLLSLAASLVVEWIGRVGRKNDHLVKLLTTKFGSS